jgi:hypothetical protein
MNYKRVHDSIINNARALNRSKKTGIYERHHIVMRAFGGGDEAENLVLLTPKEHFIIHYLLWKMNPGIRKYRDPIFMFKRKGGKNSRLYEAARLSHVHEMKTNNPSTYLSEEAKLSKSKKLKAYKKTPQHCAAISKAKQGQASRAGAVLTEDSKTQISESVKRWHEEVGVSDATRQKLREAMTGKLHSDDTIAKCKASALARPRWKCECCDKVMDGGNIVQHMMKTHKLTREYVNEYKARTETV